MTSLHCPIGLYGMQPGDRSAERSALEKGGAVVGRSSALGLYFLVPGLYRGRLRTVGRKVQR